MTVNLTLDQASINNLVLELQEFGEHIGEELVNILCIEGAEVANAAYDGMASANGGVTDAGEGITTGKIIATSSDEDSLLIAEFGAGDATIRPAMEFETSSLDAEVFPGAYSLFKGTREYYNFGSWRFGKKWYTEVPARHGMFNAKLFIQETYQRYAAEVIRF